MGIHTQVGAIGSAIHAPRNPGSTSLEEALHAVTHAALRDAGLAIVSRPTSDMLARRESITGPVLASVDAREGAAAFAERRPPNGRE